MYNRGEVIYVCVYDKDLESFLESTTEYICKKYGKELNLSNLERIELLSKESFGANSDGKTINNGKTIYISSRLAESLPCKDISKLEKNEDFQCFVSTLYHEMGYVSDWKKYPGLYSIAMKKNDSYVEWLAPQMILEYVAEKRSVDLGLFINYDICDQFVEIEWNPCRIDYYDHVGTNFLFLNKLIPYFLAKTHNKPIEKEYYSRIKNDEVKKYVKEIEIEIDLILQKELTDDENSLIGLKSIIDRFGIKIIKETNYGKDENANT